MDLSLLITELAKEVSNNASKKPSTSERILYGKIVTSDGRKFVQLDGSDLLTPVETTSSNKDGDRVTVIVRNHTATVTGNLSDPSASSAKVDEIDAIVADAVSTEELAAEIARINELKADKAVVEELEADMANIDTLVAETIDAKLVNVDSLIATKVEAKVAELDVLTAEDLEAVNADIYNLQATYARFEQVTANNFTAVNAKINTLETNQLTAEYLEANYADIKLANVETADIGTLFAKVGLITDATIQNGKITGYLDAVKVNATNITAGKLTVDRLVFRGSEKSIVYELNNITGALQAVQGDTLNGEILTDRSITVDKIVANSITANELNVSDIFGNAAVLNTLFAQEITATGSITSPVLKSTDYAYNGPALSGEDYSHTGMIVDLLHKNIRTPNFCLTSEGMMYAREVYAGVYNSINEDTSAFVFHGFTGGAVYDTDLLIIGGSTADGMTYTTHIGTNNDRFHFHNPIIGSDATFVDSVTTGSLTASTISSNDGELFVEIEDGIFRTRYDHDGDGPWLGIQMYSRFIDFYTNVDGAQYKAADMGIFSADTCFSIRAVDSIDLRIGSSHLDEHTVVSISNSDEDGYSVLVDGYLQADNLFIPNVGQFTCHGNALFAGTVRIAGEIVDDFVIEEGTSGVWRYCKWNSGKAECWARNSVSMTTWNTWGSAFLSNEISAINYPSEVGFTSAPVEVVNAHDLNSSYQLSVMVSTLDANTATKSGMYQLFRATKPSITFTAAINYYVCGNWK